MRSKKKTKQKQCVGLLILFCSLSRRPVLVWVFVHWCFKLVQTDKMFCFISFYFMIDWHCSCANQKMSLSLLGLRSFIQRSIMQSLFTRSMTHMKSTKRMGSWRYHSRAYTQCLSRYWWAAALVLLCFSLRQSWVTAWICALLQLFWVRGSEGFSFAACSLRNSMALFSTSGIFFLLLILNVQHEPS